MTSDLSHEFDRLGKVRLLAMVGKGAVQNVADIIYLKGADVSIVQSDALEYYRKNIWSGVDKSIHYITSMYDDEATSWRGATSPAWTTRPGKRSTSTFPAAGRS